MVNWQRDLHQWKNQQWESPYYPVFPILGEIVKVHNHCRYNVQDNGVEHEMSNKPLVELFISLA